MPATPYPQANRKSALLWLAAAFCFGAEGLVRAALDFNLEIRPILSEHCFRCHGFDEPARKGRLRLDTREGATQAAKSGAAAVTPGIPDKSELIHRITTADNDDLMPPPKDGKPLTTKQISLLKQWVAEGAPYARHWSFEPPKSHPVPVPAKRNWARNPIDSFVLSQLETASVTPAPEADRATLLRRVTLDLTGVPPSLAELDAFIHDSSPGAYEAAVDRLLASPRYGERMAVDWLDAARYADTNGYFGDKTRSAWPWREWVVHAFNRNEPFDQFTIEQLAGDLLPKPTRDQLIATGFHRNSMANNESGIIDEEYRVETIVDRLDATASTWMGLTIGCAQCHDHKFDPISQKDYYQLFAFFNNTPESGLAKAETPPPVIEVPSSADQARLLKIKAARTQAEAKFAPLEPDLKRQQADWESRAQAELHHPFQAESALFWPFDEKPAIPLFHEAGAGSLIYEKGIAGTSAKFDGTKYFEGPSSLPFETQKPGSIAFWIKTDGSLSGILSKIEPTQERKGFEMIWQKGRVQINLVHRWGASAIEAVTRDPLDTKNWHHLILNCDGTGRAAGLQLLVDGLPVALEIRRDTLDGSIANRVPLLLGRRDSGLGFYGSLDEFRILAHTVTEEQARQWFWSERLTGIITTPSNQRSAADAALLRDYHTTHHAPAESRAAYEAVKHTTEQEALLRAAIPTALVMRELPQPRESHILMRGQYDSPGAAVQADVPSSLAPLPAGAPRNRLGLAQWLVSPQNPLTSRVIVNRLWQQCFGEGLVRSVNDFGSQGEPPTHPALLDWLALRLIRNGWDIKATLRLIVTSSTYRQSSRATADLLQRDPENRLLARGPRFRMSAEMLRDQALAVSGLLVDRVGGPSVRPMQPPGLWEAVSYNGEESYLPDMGEGLWRRTLYTFWKRQAPPPATLAFDGPTREKCNIRRARTNTPLQALVLLNDETFMEAARALASAALRLTGSTPQRLSVLFRTVTSRMPENEEVTALETLLRKQMQRGATEQEAWQLAAHAILNLDEAITRR